MSPVSQSDRSFDQIALNFDRFAELVGGPLNRFLETVFPERGERAIDLGCGSGRHASMLAGRFREVVAVDVSGPMLQIARARRGHPNVTYAERDLCDVRADTDGRFDLVFSSYALHHVAELERTLHGIRELVAPGGRVVLIDNVSPRPAVPRFWFIRQAVRTLADDLLRRRRPVAEAFELYRLNTHPAWLDHVTTDRFLNRADFGRRYGSVFPEARYTEMYRACALCWDAPAP